VILRDNHVDTTELCELFAHLLEIDSVEPDDDLFDLGGDSLAAAQIIGETYRILGARCRLVDFLGEPTPAHLSGLVAAALAEQP
jgi:phthiocerol/phenolphthiocerol synthesis type-I polyketide synthase E